MSPERGEKHAATTVVPMPLCSAVLFATSITSRFALRIAAERRRAPEGIPKRSNSGCSCVFLMVAPK
jgi:hypothetical protein